MVMYTIYVSRGMLSHLRILSVPVAKKYVKKKKKMYILAATNQSVIKCYKFLQQKLAVLDYVTAVFKTTI